MEEAALADSGGGASPLRGSDTAAPYKWREDALQPQPGWIEKCVADGKQVAHYVGKADSLGPITVSAVEEEVKGRKQIVALIRSANGDQVVRVDATVLGSKKRSPASATLSRRSGASKPLPDSAVMEAIAPVLSAATDKEPPLLTRVPKGREIEMRRYLLQQEIEGKQRAHKVRNWEVSGAAHFAQFGVLRQCRGQSRQDEVLGNESSPDFERFLRFLGDTVVLQGWTAFSGGLDTTDKGYTGLHSVYAKVSCALQSLPFVSPTPALRPPTQRGELEAMFHVGPMLPKGEGKEQELGRKRHIGNDVVLIVYQVRVPALRHEPC